MRLFDYYYDDVDDDDDDDDDDDTVQAVVYCILWKLSLRTFSRCFSFLLTFTGK